LVSMYEAFRPFIYVHSVPRRRICVGVEFENLHEETVMSGHPH
jgi:hypothetical protein